MSLSTPQFLCLAVAATLLLGGCLPECVTYADALTGRVINRASNLPVQGATVAMAAGNDTVQTHTDQTGSFRLPALRGWVLHPVFSEGCVYYADLRVQAAGFRSASTKVGDFPALLEGRAHEKPDVFGFQPSPDGSSRVRITLTPGT